MAIDTKKFEELKAIIIRRIAPCVQEEALLKAIIAGLDEYQELFLKCMADMEKRRGRVSEENDLLRSLIGLTETDIRAKTVAQGEEIRFAREQLAGARQSIEALEKDKDALYLENARLKKEIDDQKHCREEDQSRFNEELNKLNRLLKGLGEKSDKEKDAFAAEKQRMQMELEQLDKKVYRQVLSDIHQELRLLGVHLRNIGSVISGSAGYCLEKLQQLKVVSSAPKSSGLGPRVERLMQRLSGKYNYELTEFIPDVELLDQNGKEIIASLDEYSQLLKPLTLTPAEIDFVKLWVEIDGRFRERLEKVNAKLVLPKEKKYPRFFADPAMLSLIIETLAANALESLESGGTVEVAGKFSEQELTLRVSDNGSGVSPEYRLTLFLPFVTNKLEHKGLGLARIYKIIKSIEGTITYQPLEKGSAFTVTIPGTPKPEM
jgi:signal transduction histidine kinase